MISNTTTDHLLSLDMMDAKEASRTYTLAEYLALEQETQTKYEFHQGEVFAQAGGSLPHGLLIGNIYLELQNRLKEQGSHCRALTSEVKLSLASTQSYVYPDAMVVCGEFEVAEELPDAITNPTLVVEVLSPSSADYDRGGKFDRYSQLPSLKEYVLIWQEEPRVEVFYRAEPNEIWQYQSVKSLAEVIEFTSLGISLPLADLYEGISFAE